MVTIKVLGSGCANCKRLEQMVRTAIGELSAQAEVQKVTEYPEIMKYRVMSTPGLVIDEKLVSSGRIPAMAEIKDWIGKAEQGSAL